MSDVASDDVGKGPLGLVEDARVQVTTIVIYAAITLLAVLVAATAKQYVETTGEVLLVAFGTCLGLCIAHAWATILAEVLMRNHILSPGLVLHEAMVSSAAFIPALLVLVCAGVAALVDGSFEASVILVLLGLVALLFVTALLAARRLGASWLSSTGWGITSAAIGFAIVALKFILGV